MSSKNKFIKLRVSGKEVADLKDEAAKYGYELSSYMRYRIFGKREGLRIVHRPSV